MAVETIYREAVLKPLRKKLETPLEPFMKALKFVALAVSLLSFSAAAHAESVESIFTYNNSSFLSGDSLEVNILDNGLLHAKRVKYEGDRTVVKFDEAFARLEERDLEVVKSYLARVKPGMKLRELTREEKARNKMCASDSALSYRVGSTVVAQNNNCIMVGLKDANAARAVKSVMQTVTDAVSENSKRIYGY